MNYHASCSIIALFFLSLSCAAHEEPITVGAASTEAYFPLLQHKRIAVMTNHTGRVGEEHLVDMLHREQFQLTAIFSPEHGFRGDLEAGEAVPYAKDKKTGIPIFSLYNGKVQRPNKRLMSSFDVLIVDIQDVGVRFYTYYISMLHLMDVCAEYGKQMIVLDRPNPNGHYVDGPILDMKHRSEVGGLPVPVVHGMTLGELALMINGEQWLPNKKACLLTVIPCRNYSHQSKYNLPIPPSPNLPSMKAVYLYPSICLFEATPVSLGRGTPFPFQVYGHPNLTNDPFCFTPRSVPAAQHPPQMNKVCCGVDLRNLPNEAIWEKGVDLAYLIKVYRQLNTGDAFLSPFFEKLIGVDYVRRMIIDGKTAEEIKAVWQPDVVFFKQQRRKYLLYRE